MADSVDESQLPNKKLSEKAGNIPLAVPGEPSGLNASSVAGSLGAAGLASTGFGSHADGKIISARGTEDGLVLRIDGKAEWSEVLAELDSFFGGRRKFFEGGQVAIEWLDRLPTVEQGKELEQILREGYGVEVLVRRKRPSQLSVASAREMAAKAQTKEPSPTINLFQEVEAGNVSDGQFPGEHRPSGISGGFHSGPEASTASSGAAHFGFDSLERSDMPRSASNSNRSTTQGRAGASAKAGMNSSFSHNADYHTTNSGLPAEIEAELTSYVGNNPSNRYASRMAKMLGDDIFYEDDANAKIVFGTLRSGQRLETPFSLIVIGDVNPGADLVAGGDIIVFGNLRGTAHASAYDDDAFDRVIIAVQMQPMQLRIGSVISRGSDELVRGSEIARIENRRIIVEAFNPRMLLGRKFR